MVALVTGQVPWQAITTVERMNVWTSLILQNAVPNTTVEELNGVVELVASSSPYFITVDSADFHWRVASRTSLRLANTWTRTGRIWTHVQEVATTTIPVEFTQV